MPAEDPESEQQITAKNPICRAPDMTYRQGRRNVEGFRLRCDRSVDRRIEMMREPGNSRMHVDIAHRYVRHAGFLRIAGQTRAINSELAPRSSKKWCSVEILSARRTPASAACTMRSRSVLGGTYPCAAEKRCNLRLGQPLVVSLVAQRHRYGVNLLEEGRHHVDGKLAAQRLRDLATRKLDTLLESVIGDDFDDALLDLECPHGGLYDLR